MAKEYPTYRRSLYAKNVVATSQPLASQAGLRMLLQGGNAVDAAVVAAIALTVLEPTSNGIGSDAFAILWDGKEFHGLNASGQSPQAASDGPRWQVMEDGTLHVEEAMPTKAVAGLLKLGHDVVVVSGYANQSFGGAQLIRRLDGYYESGSDHRKDGMSAGF